MDTKNRLQKLIDFFASSQSDFAEKIGVTRATISHILSGRNGMSADVTNKIIKKFPSVTYEWLQSGKAPPPTFNKGTLNFTPPSKNFNSQEQKKHTVSEPVAEKENDKQAPQTNFITKNQNIEKIVFFYKDGTFKIFVNDE